MRGSVTFVHSLNSFVVIRHCRKLKPHPLLQIGFTVIRIPGSLLVVCLLTVHRHRLDAGERGVCRAKGIEKSLFLILIANFRSRAYVQIVQACVLCAREERL
jgi:hypothetical protein